MSNQSDAAVRTATDAPAANSRPGLVAAAGIFGALAASSCCILPLVLFTIGVSGAWIGNLTRLAPYQPYLIAGTTALLAYGYWLIRRASNAECAEAASCAHPRSRRFVKICLYLATALVFAALAVDIFGRFLIDS